jgi:hypothetical protein
VNAGGTMIVRGDMLIQSSLDIAGTVIIEADAPAPAFDNAIAWETSNLQTGNLSAAVPEPGVGALLLAAATLLGARPGKARNELNSAQRRDPEVRL